GGRRFRHDGELAVVPREPAALHHDPGDRHPVTTYELGGGVDDDVGSVLDRPAQVGSGEGVVDHQGDVVRVGHLGEPGDVEHVRLGVPDRLAINELRAIGDGGVDGVEVGRVDERGVD